MGLLQLTIRGPGNQSPTTLTLAEPQVTFGRSNLCDVQLPFTTVSNHHLTFIRGLNHFSVTDMGTTNGTFVDGQRIPPNTYVAIVKPMQLRIVDLIVDLSPVVHMPPGGFTLAESATMVRKMASDAMRTSSGAPKDTAFFEILSGPGCGRRINFLDDLEEAWLGNNPKNEVFIDDARVPERVARIVGNGAGFDLEACPGCSFSVNGELCTTMHPLRSQDRVIIESMELYFYDPLQKYLDTLETQSQDPDADSAEPSTVEPATQSEDIERAEDQEIQRAPLSALERTMLAMSVFFIIATFMIFLLVFNIV